jgi:hypothetical protein
LYLYVSSCDEKDRYIPVPFVPFSASDSQPLLKLALDSVQLVLATSGTQQQKQHNHFLIGHFNTTHYIDPNHYRYSCCWQSEYKVLPNTLGTEVGTYRYNYQFISYSPLGYMSIALGK